MKRGFLAVLLLFAASLGAFAQKAVTLDEAIKTAADEIGGSLEKRTKIAVLNFKSISQTLSDYMAEEMNNALINDGRLQVQARNLEVLELARKELEFNDSDEVSNKSAQKIGEMLGAQTFINGSMERVGNTYRLRIQVLEVATLTMRYGKSLNIRDDQLVKSLMAGVSSTPIAVDQDFTAAQRAGAVALNLLLGAGSFWQKDKVGGTWTAVLEGLGLGVFIAGEVAISSVKSQMNNSDDYSGEGNYWLEVAGVRVVDILVASGLALYGAGFVVGTVSACTFHKPGYIASIAEPFNIALVSDYRGNTGLQLSYTMHY